jgi:lipopolysaccharide transport system ATP-binding protein
VLKKISWTSSDTGDRVMNDIVIRVEHLSKEYHLGTISHGTLYHDLQSGWAKFRGREDPNARIGSVHPGPLNNTDTRFYALKDVSFDVQQGEVVGIIGRNGAGKSTLLKIISRVTAPTQGSIKIRGRIASLLEVGTGFHPELTGRENIFLNGAILGMRKGEIEQKFDEIVRFSEIEQFIDTPVKRYSSGMYVRLAFAVAAHLEPEILLVDEVLAVGDAQFQKKCLGKMGDIVKEGRTVLYVSHNLESVANLCEKCILLDRGTLRLYDRSKTVIHDYFSMNTPPQDSDLRQRTDRAGNGSLRFEHTWIETEEGKIAGFLKTGQTFKIVATYQINPGNSIKNLDIAIAINTPTGISVTDLGNIMTGEIFSGEIPKKGRIECTIKKFPLNTGVYSYNLQAKAGNFELLDYLVNANSFRLESADFYGTGHIPDSTRLLLLDHTWHLESNG